MRRASRVLLAAVSAVALVLIAGLAYVAASGNLNWLRGPLESLAQRSTGRTLHIGGDLRVDLVPRLRVVAEDVRFANPDWARHRWLLEGRRVGLVLDGGALLHAKLRFAEVSLEGTRVALERDREGRKSWVLDASSSTDGALQERIGALTVRDGTLFYDDPRIDTALSVALQTSGGGRLPTGFRAKGQYHGRKLQAAGDAGAMLSIADATRPFPLRGTVQAGATRAVVSGTVTNLATFGQADLQITLEGRDLAALYPLLPVALPQTKPYRLEGALLHDGARWELRNFEGRIGNSDLSGTLIYMRAQGEATKPKLRGAARSRRLDLADLSGFLGENPRPENKPGGRVLPSKPYQVERIRAMDVDVHFEGRRILRPKELPLQDFAAHLVIDGGVARLDPFEFGIAEGTISGRARLDARRSPLRARLEARAQRLRLTELLPDAPEKKNGSARLGGLADLRGSGNSLAKFLATAQGDVQLVTSGGTVSALMVELGGLDLGEALVVLMGGDKPVPVRCGVARFSVERGVMNAEQLVLDTSDTLIVGGGRIDLADETLSLVFKPKPKDASILSASSPLRIDGTFARPELHPDRKALAARGAAAVLLGLVNPLAALIPLVEIGQGEDANCAALMNDARRSKPSVNRSRS